MHAMLSPFALLESPGVFAHGPVDTLTSSISIGNLPKPMPAYDFDLSLPFSPGEVPAARTFMNFFSVSNQKGAPREAAMALRIHLPRGWERCF